MSYRDVVDAEDLVVGQATKEEIEAQGLICRVALILLLNRNGEVLLQQRKATKRFYPLYWSGSAAGHLASGETYQSGGTRETREELGVDVDLTFLGRYLSEEDREMVGVLYGYHDGPFTIEPAEVERAEFLSIASIHDEHARGDMKMTTFLTRSLPLLQDALAAPARKTT